MFPPLSLIRERRKLDIDTDFPGLRREEIKQYMEQRYGEEYVCSVGTYSLFQLKSCIKDLGKQFGVPFDETNPCTEAVGKKAKTMNDLFQVAKSEKRLSSFIKNYPEVINDMFLILGQPKSASIHACATIIFPKEKNMFKSVPVRKQNGIIVSEWEGEELESAGYLKEDILGIKELDKFARIIELVKESTGKDISIYNIPLDDPKVYKYFQNGWNGDVFHFGSPGLTGYCKEMKPKNINELTAAISLYRPGAMENNFHNEYILRMNGEKEVDYMPGLKDVTVDTYGLLIYQEQIMRAVTDIANFTLVEADAIRKAMGHKKVDLLRSYKDRFISGGEANGFDLTDLEDVWETLFKFAGYSFNKSHAVAYTITGYICQYLKVYYPVQYWMTALEFAEQKKIPEYISEIYRTGEIRIIGADINKSYKEIKADYKNSKIYWSLLTLKNVGDAAVDQIMQERGENGEYFSFEEFYTRNKFKGSKITKRNIEPLILAGAFDKIEGISEVKNRVDILNQFRTLSKAKIDPEKDLFEKNREQLDKNIWWDIQEKVYSSLAFIDYEHLCINQLSAGEYIDIEQFHELPNATYLKTGGFVVDIAEKENKKGKWCLITVENNYTFFKIVVWAEQYKYFSEKILASKKRCVLFSGTVNYDKYRKENILTFNKKSQLILL